MIPEIVIQDSIVQSRWCEPKPWMRHQRCYRKRVNKKWLKRFGLKKLIGDGDAVKLENNLFLMNSVTAKQYRRNLLTGTVSYLRLVKL